ncbi:MAG: sensor histidine kinase [Anaerolineae bacterium]
MTQPQPAQQDDAGDVLQRIHMLGSVTEDLFNRLYSGINRRRQLTDALEQLENMDVRNRQLREALKDKTIENQRLTSILASISEGIILQDTDGRIVLMNSAAQELLGSNRNFWSTELGILFRESRDVITVGSEIVPVGEARRVRVNQRMVSAQIASIADQNDERIGTLMILRDVTEDDISARMKNSFVTHISHELITPLAPMRVASEILLNTPEGQAPNPRMLEMISKNVDILDRLVTEMLDMSAMTSGEFNIKHESLMLEDLVLEVVQDFLPDLNDGKLDLFLMFKHTQDVALFGDQKHLRWALSNLLRNAIQYTLPDQSIWVGVGSERNTPHEVFFEIKDFGVGIAEDDLPHIFDLFYRGDARTENGKKLDPRGLGQGLFVAKTIARAHGGSLTVDSTRYQGSTFKLVIPRNLPKSLPS